ncbi:MAG: SCO family protein [Acidobacteria bacterium]|nr:SCO family protein [Acidobacteriota bacterium]
MVHMPIRGKSDSGGRGYYTRLSVRLVVIIAFSTLLGFGYPRAAQAQISKLLQVRGFQGPPQGGATAQNSKVLPPALRNVGIDQELNHQIPLDLVFRDETGKTVRLGDYFGKKPVILSLVYFNCPQLCPMVESGLVMSLRDLKFDVGNQFNVLTVSFDPQDTPFEAYSKRAVYLSMYNRKGASAGWHFLTGGQASITALTKAVGFRYNYDPKTKQYYHATAIVVLTPQGRVAQYFYGIRYPAGQLRLALVQASNGKIGSPVDALLLFCCRYDPATGKYSLIISRVLFIAALLTVILLGGFLFILFRSGRRAQPGALITHTSVKVEQ